MSEFLTPEQLFEYLEKVWNDFERRVGWEELFGFNWSRAQREQLRGFVLTWALYALYEVRVLEGDEWDTLADRVADRLRLIEGFDSYLREEDE